MNDATQKEIVTREFAALGFSVLHWNDHPSNNGVDCWVQKNKGRPLSVEVKLLRKQKSGMVQCDPVSKGRASDDLIAIIMNTEYVLIEPMRDHLKACSPKGTRQFTLLCKGKLELKPRTSERAT